MAWVFFIYMHKLLHLHSGRQKHWVRDWCHGDEGLLFKRPVTIIWCVLLTITRYYIRCTLTYMGFRFKLSSKSSWVVDPADCNHKWLRKYSTWTHPWFNCWLMTYYRHHNDAAVNKLVTRDVKFWRYFCVTQLRAWINSAPTWIFHSCNEVKGLWTPNHHTQVWFFPKTLPRHLKVHNYIWCCTITNLFHKACFSHIVYVKAFVNKK